MKVSELKEHILKHMTADEALTKLLEGSLMSYEKLKFEVNKEVHPILVITYAAMDLGWTLSIEKNSEDIRGLSVGTKEYIEDLFKENGK